MTELLNKITQGDTIEVMRAIPDKSVDMILCDLPYGTTACKWDTIIPFEPLWVEYERIIKDNGAIVLTSSQPFTSALVMSNPKLFKYEWIWEKSVPSNPALAKKHPLKYHESILVFYKKHGTYNPQMWQGEPSHSMGNKPRKTESVHGYSTNYRSTPNDGRKYPKSIQKFSRQVGLHPTQKPVPLFEYLIKTYTNEGEIVLDNCIGSGTTAVAAINTGRQFIGIEREPEYVAIANKRIDDARNAN